MKNSNFVIATAARLAAETYTGRPCSVLNYSSKLGVAYEIATGAGCSKIARVYMDGRVEWRFTGYVPRDLDDRMAVVMRNLMPTARRVAASW